MELLQWLLLLYKWGLFSTQFSRVLALSTNLHFTRRYNATPAVLFSANHSTTAHGNSAPVHNRITTWIKVNHFLKFKQYVCKSFSTLQEFLTINLYERKRLIQRIGRNFRHSLLFWSFRLPYQRKGRFKVYYVHFQGAKSNNFREFTTAENWYFSI